jgi:hypothetical protein
MCTYRTDSVIPTVPTYSQHIHYTCKHSNCLVYLFILPLKEYISTFVQTFFNNIFLGQSPYYSLWITQSIHFKSNSQQLCLLCFPKKPSFLTM